MMRIKISIILFMIWSSTTHAQKFDYEADLSPISLSGYYTIELPPEALGKMNHNLSDLRIYDLSSIEQPYLIEQESLIITKKTFNAYEIRERNNSKIDSSSFVVFANNQNKPIDHLSFIVQNTTVRKTAILSGSNDLENWYVISSDYVLHSMHNNQGTTFKKRLDFPLSDYAYFKLEVKENVKEPINILEIGYEEHTSTQGLVSSFDFRINSQKDSANRSYIKLSLSEKKYFEKLHFQFSGADFYSRNASIYLSQIIENNKNQRAIVKKPVGSVKLHSNSSNTFDVDPMSVDELFIEIDNKNNQPLTLINASGHYLKKYIVINLNAKTSYKFKFGNKEMRPPSYDIAYFKQQIPNEIQTAELLNIRTLTREYKEEKEMSLFENVYLIWSIIGVVGLFLGLVSIKMIKELGHLD